MRRLRITAESTLKVLSNRKNLVQLSFCLGCFFLWNIGFSQTTTDDPGKFLDDSYNWGIKGKKLILLILDIVALIGAASVMYMLWSGKHKDETKESLIKVMMGLCVYFIFSKYFG